MIRNTLILAFSFILLPFLDVGAITLTQSISKTEMKFDDSVKFEITVEWAGPQSAFRFPKPLNPYTDRLKIGPFSSSINSTGQNENEITTKKFTYILVPTSGGTGTIDPITISYISWPDSVPGELVTERVTLSIADPIIVEKEESSSLWLYIVGGLLLVGGGAAFFVMKVRTDKNKLPVITPVDTALEDLAKTKAESGSDLKKFQTGIYNLLSEFLYSRYNISVGGLNETELKERLSKTSLSENNKSSIINWLQQAERDKFRPIDASPGETVRLENEIRKFFENLKV